MAFILHDRVKESTTTTGTGTIDLDGAIGGFKTFVAGIGTTNRTYYAIVGRTTTEFEIGLGTVTDASTDTLSRKLYQVQTVMLKLVLVQAQKMFFVLYRHQKKVCHFLQLILVVHQHHRL